ncbi:hypothetical protein [Campylobacter mucosalis]|uniref:hypothetical protein n=1 Tax=Campylobacter mucosalis TaxID=202 RepID=UPI0014704C81|nr:hypothetical protein [Campylobacter mucosalis]
MTNREMCDFYEKIHSTLKTKIRGKTFLIKEQGKESAIKELHIDFKNKQDVAIIQQQSGNCNPITNLFRDVTNLKSCDFIVLINTGNNIKIYFCEIKSSVTKENEKIANLQLKSSKLFLEYLEKNYRLYFNKSKQEFDLKIDQSKFIILYPEYPLSQKRTTQGNNLFKSIQVDERGISKIQNGYDFFKNM